MIESVLALKPEPNHGLEQRSNHESIRSVIRLKQSITRVRPGIKARIGSRY